MNDKVTFTDNGVVYHWSGGFGAIVKSHEFGVKPGDCRVIGGFLFHVAYMYPKTFAAPEVCWTVLDVSIDKVEEIHKKFFGR